MSLTCRACSQRNLEQVLDLGSIPLAGDFDHGLDAALYSLAIDHCTDCDLLQVRDTVPHTVIYNENYGYASSTVPALVRHFHGLAEQIGAWVSKGAAVLEIGCNDGILLQHLKTAGFTNVLGIDASANVVQLARDRGLNADCVRFGSTTAKNVSGPFDLVTCSNVFAHNADPLDFLLGIRQVLRVGGHLVIEVHDAVQLYARNQWDCFYHEHVFYWTSRAISNFLTANGFQVHSIDKTPMHGGALRVHATYHTGSPTWEVVDPMTDWKLFGARACRSAEILNKVVQMPGEHDGVVLFGAAGRATTLVHFANLAAHLQWAYDGSPLRIGKYVPGTGIPILPEVRINHIERPTMFLLGAWHLRDDLVRKIKSHSRVPDAGIIVPLPHVEVF